MPTFRILVMLAAATIAMIDGPIPLGAQTTPAPNKSDSIAIHISLAKSSFAIGEKPIAVITIINMSPNKIWFSTDPYLERVHITSKDGEPPKTELYRHLLGEFRPGDGPGLMAGPVVGRPIGSGFMDSEKWDLSGYYDLSSPGLYSVYIEIYDPLGPRDRSGRWLRTNTVQFTIQSPAS